MRHSETHIQTERLWLREIDESDTETIVKLRSRPTAYRFFSAPHRITKKEHLNWFRTVYCKEPDRVDWLAVDDVDGRVVGVYGAKKCGEKAVEVSYLTSPGLQGKGYAAEAVGAILKWTKLRWGSKSALAVIHRENEASIHFIETMGFSKGNSCDCFEHYMRTL